MFAFAALKIGSIVPQAPDQQADPPLVRPAYVHNNSRSTAAHFLLKSSSLL